MRRKLSRSGFLTVANYRVLLHRTIRLDFSFIVSFRPAPFIFELHKRTTYSELLYILYTIALLRLIHGLSHGTRHSILQALLNATLILIDILSQRRLESELGCIINCRTCYICQHSKLGSAFEI